MVAEPYRRGGRSDEARPRVHFTPPFGWLNDPNGLVHVDGVYHLCYQHHPDDVLWGPMHWGHATSPDLVTWEDQPVALVPDHLGAAFSGSAVVDPDGVAGFGARSLIAFYTHFLEDVPQCQGLAYSSDGGTTWKTYDGNPVLSAPPGLVDFRDPKVLRLAGEERPWLMVLVAGQEVLFYRSQDLISWHAVGSFGDGYGAHGGVWETPDLFELPVEGTAARRWVLTVSVQDGGPAGGSGTQYFLGDFDGSTFRCDDDPATVRWVDHGADFYAPQSWSDAPAGRRVWMAWMSNWRYARDTPASSWRGAMTLPRDLSLVERPQGPVLAQRPVVELDARSRELVAPTDRRLTPGTEVVLAEGLVAGDLSFSCRARAAGSVWVELRRGAATSRVVYDGARRMLLVEPAPGGLPPGSREDRQAVAVTPQGDELDVRVLVDSTSMEVFVDGGTVVLTNQVFGDVTTAVVLGADGGEVTAARVALRALGSEDQDGVSRPDSPGEGARG